ncbi:MAG: hypothetical protein ACLFVG_01100 [Candidatus Aminicenantes bacterium]
MLTPLDFFCQLDKNLKTMKDIWRSLLAILVASSAFLLGFYLGGEKIKSKIPDFQEDLEEKP